MIKIKVFKLAEAEGFNEFVVTHPPRDEQSVKMNGDNIIIMYEDGEPMPKAEKLSTLRMKIRTHDKNILGYHQQYLSFKMQYEAAVASEQAMQVDLDQNENDLAAMKEKVRGLKGKEQEATNREIIALTRTIKAEKDLLKSSTSEFRKNSIITSKSQLEIEKVEKAATEELLAILEKE